MESKRKYRTAIFYKDYFEKFFLKQSEKIKAKIIWTIQLIEELERIPETYLKHVESPDGLYEIRIKFGKDGEKNSLFFLLFCPGLFGQLDYALYVFLF